MEMCSDSGARLIFLIRDPNRFYYFLKIKKNLSIHPDCAKSSVLPLVSFIESKAIRILDKSKSFPKILNEL